MKKITIGLILITLLLAFYIYSKTSTQKNEIETNNDIIDEIKEETTSSNIIENVKYSSKDTEGNEYIIEAKEGEIDINANNIIFLKKVNAFINLSNSEKIFISADFGKYNINNFDTIFSKNVIMKYLDKKITSEYLDFSILRNSMIISKNVIYKDKENTLKTDVIEININTKDTKFFMYNKNKKVIFINKK